MIVGGLKSPYNCIVKIKKYGRINRTINIYNVIT